MEKQKGRMLGGRIEVNLVIEGEALEKMLEVIALILEKLLKVEK